MPAVHVAALVAVLCTSMYGTAAADECGVVVVGGATGDNTGDFSVTASSPSCTQPTATVVAGTGRVPVGLAAVCGGEAVTSVTVEGEGNAFWNISSVELCGVVLAVRGGNGARSHVVSTRTRAVVWEVLQLTGTDTPTRLTSSYAALHEAEGNTRDMLILGETVNTTDPTTGDASHTAVYVGVIVFAVFACVCAVAAAEVCRRRMRILHTHRRKADHASSTPHTYRSMLVDDDGQSNNPLGTHTGAYEPPGGPTVGNAGTLLSLGQEPVESVYVSSNRIGPQNRDYLCFETNGVLGKGAFGVVYRVKVTATRRIVAMKQQAKATSEHANHSLKEVELIRNVPHPYLVELYDVIYERDTQVLRVFMECVSGGTLLDKVMSLPDALPEEQAAKYTRQILLGLAHLHSNNIIHRDVKAENVLLTNEDNVKLCDYGGLKEIRMETLMQTVSLTAGTEPANTVYGSPNWLAPEVVTTGDEHQMVGPPADIYSLGCTVSEILNRGVPPGDDARFGNIWQMVMHLQRHRGPPANLVTNVSEEAASFIAAAVLVDPDTRPTAKTCLSHPFLTRFPSVASADTETSLLSKGMMESWLRVDETPLGSGSFGVVYHGQVSDGSSVAVKQIMLEDANSRQRERLSEELRVMEMVVHRNIVQYLGHHWRDKQLQIFLELVSGGSVRDKVKKLGRLPDELVHKYTTQALEGLQYLHAGGAGRPPIAHRDVKGDNMLVSGDVLKLADFGCSKLLEDGMHSVGAVGANTFAGTPNWMSPEVLMSGSKGGKYGTKCDIWSLGCTVIEMMGTTPWRLQGAEGHFAMLRRIADSTGGPPLPDRVSSTLAHFLNKCFIRDPSQRASASDLLQHDYITGRCVVLD